MKSGKRPKVKPVVVLNAPLLVAKFMMGKDCPTRGPNPLTKLTFRAPAKLALPVLFNRLKSSLAGVPPIWTFSAKLSRFCSRY